MSWSELERLVDDAEADTTVQRALRHCRCQQELVLASRRLGYRITRVDLLRAWQLHCREQPLQQGRG
ncbi:MAG: Nif11 family protein [Cyanobacteria bacterium M_DeepCast_100m_m1_067]|nr:Nif11 family protein [Cyanobacteria bacterium M_DeepCast_100m_m1_067]